MIKNILLLMITVCLSMFFFSGCRSTKGNVGNLHAYSFDDNEAQWIRDGEAIEFEGDLWGPQDDTERLLDSEVSLVGEHKGVQFFIDKIDVRPYKRLYTKFGRTQFRYYIKRAKE